MADPEHQRLVDAAVRLLGNEEVPDGVTFLESEGNVMRLRLGSGRSVIVKQVMDDTFDHADHHGPPQRFLNEAASLQFLGGLSVAPELHGADRDVGMLVLEDLGDIENLQRSLLDGTRSESEEGLVDFAAALARMHGLASGKEAAFTDVQDAWGTVSPKSDTTIDQRERHDMFSACFDAVGLQMSDRLWRSVCRVEETMHGSGPMRTLVHADAGPHNVLLGEEARLIDFEFAVFSNAAADAVGPRLGFPQSAKAMRVPGEAASRFEDSYRNELSGFIAEAQDDEVFVTSLSAACAHWALNRMAAAWRLHVAPRVENREPLPRQEAQRVAATFLVVDGLVQVANQHGEVGELAEMLAACCRVWRRRWPEIEDADVYPVFRNG